MTIKHFLVGSLLATMATSASAVGYVWDDGFSESSIGFGSGAAGDAQMIWLNRFTAVAGGETITSIEVGFSNTQAPGVAVDIHLWSDPNGDGNPNDALLQRTNNGVTANELVGANVFNSYAITPYTMTAGTSFFVGCRWLRTGLPRSFAAALDTTAPNNVQSWLLANGDGSAVNPNNMGAHTLIGTIDSFGLPGDWLIRATGTAVPEPATCAALGIGILALLSRRAKK